MLVGMAVTFAGVATLAAVGGGWAVQANQAGRWAALVLLAFFGLTLLLPGHCRPGDAAAGPPRRAPFRARPRARSATASAASLLLGVATGLLWAPCAGPILGLILTGAALNGASVEHHPAAARLCARRGDLAGAGAADRRPGVRGDEEVARRRRMGAPRPRPARPARRRRDRARPRHDLSRAPVERADRRDRADASPAASARTCRAASSEVSEGADGQPQPAGRARDAAARRHHPMAQLAPADPREPARQGRADRFLDLFLHQLHPLDPLCAAPGTSATRATGWS